MVEIGSATQREIKDYKREEIRKLRNSKRKLMLDE